MFWHWLTNTTAGSVVFVLLMVIIAMLAYFIPTLLAYALQTPNVFRIAIVNGLIGWTVIGWIVCLVWALWASKHAETFDET